MDARGGHNATFRSEAVVDTVPVVLRNLPWLHEFGPWSQQEIFSHLVDLFRDEGLVRSEHAEPHIVHLSELHYAWQFSLHRARSSQDAGELMQLVAASGKCAAMVMRLYRALGIAGRVEGAAQGKSVVRAVDIEALDAYDDLDAVGPAGGS